MLILTHKPQLALWVLLHFKLLNNYSTLLYISALYFLFTIKIVIQYLTEADAFEALRTDSSILAVAAFKHAVNICVFKFQFCFQSAEDEFVWYSLDFVLPRVAFFRKEYYDSDKVSHC